jgi:hypothetical protein
VDVGEDMSDYTGQDNGTLRVTIREAAHRLGVTEAAVRKRIQRGSLDKEMGEDGRVYVYLDLSQDMSHPESQVDHEPLLEELRDRVRSLERRLDEERESRRRADMIIAQLTQANAALATKVPELEASQEARGGPESVAEETERAEPRSGTPSPQESVERPPDTAEWPVRGGSLTRPWWRRVLGG